MTETSSLPQDLSIDQQLALQTGAANLRHEFADVFEVGTIERLLHFTYDQLANRASVPNYLPLLAERIARQRLRELAEVGGLSS